MPQSSGPTLGSGSVVGLGDVIDVTLSLDTSIYADNDVLAAPQEVTNFFRVPGGRAFLHSLKLQDNSDQAVDVEILFLNATGSLGAENAAFSPTDAVAETIIGRVLIATSDYSDADNSQFAFKDNIGLMLKAAESTTSVWVGAVVRSGTPTYAATGIKLKIGVMWD
jgi:hypothetical protein